MGLLGTLGVKLTAETAAFTKDIKAATAAVRDNADTIKKLTAGAAVGFAAGGVVTMKLIGAASDAAEQLNVLGIAFGDNVGAVVEWAAESSKALGRSQTDLKDYAGQVGAMLSPTMGVTRATANMSMNLATLAVDLGSVFNAMETDTLAALKAAMIGQSEPMQKFGVVMNVATLEAYALSKGIKKTYKNMTEAEKTQLRYAFLMEQTSASQGDATNTADGWANMTKRVAGQVTDLSAQVGAGLLPYAERLISVVSEIVGWFQELSDETLGYVGIAIGVGTALAGIAASVGALSLALPALVAGLTAAAVAMWAIALPVGILALKLAVAVLAFALLKKAWKEDLLGMRTYLTPFVNWVGETWEKLTTYLSKAWKDSMRAIGDQARKIAPEALAYLELVSPNAALAIKALQGLGAETEESANAWSTLKDKAGDALDDLKDTAGVTFDFVVDALKELGESLGITGENLDALIAKIKRAAEAAFAGAKPPGGGGGGGGGGGAGGGDGYQDYRVDIGGGGGGEDLMGAFREKVETAFAGAGASISSALGGAAMMFADALSSAAPRIGAIINGAVEGFKTDGIEGAVIGAVVAFVMTLEPVLRLFKILERSLDPLVEVISSILDPFVDLIDAFTSFVECFARLGNAALPIAPILQVVAAVFEIVADAFMWVAEGIGELTEWFVTAWEDVMYEIGKFFRGWFNDIADKLQGPKLKREFDVVLAEQVGMWAALARSVAASSGDAKSAVADEAAAKAAADEAAAKATNELERSAREAAKSFKESSSSLFGVPEGFKIAAARFAAISTGGGVGGMGAAAAGAGVGGSRLFQIGNVYVAADDPRQFMAALEAEADWQNFASDGTPILTPPDPNKR